MVTLQPKNNVEPFNHKRKGEANEYKVSTDHNRALATATNQSVAAYYSYAPSSNHYLLINYTDIIVCIIIYTHLWALLNQKN